MPYHDLYDVDLLGRRPEFLPPGVDVHPLVLREYSYSQPGMVVLRVTRSRAYCDDRVSSLEQPSPGSSLFPTDKASDAAPDQPPRHLRELLQPP